MLNYAVIGTGDTGLSIINYLCYKQCNLKKVFDTRTNPPNIQKIENLLSNYNLALNSIEYHFGDLNYLDFIDIDVVVLSPGVSIYENTINYLLKNNKQVIGDIELFALAINDDNAWQHTKMIAITGSNGKTTVTTLTGYLLQSLDLDVMVAGNIGEPILDAYLRYITKNIVPDVVVLELSSFQLEVTYSLQLNVATVLNISEDHLDRYRNLLEYSYIKDNIFNNSLIQILNHDDILVRSMLRKTQKQVYFSITKPNYINHNTLYYYLLLENNEYYLMINDKKFVSCNDMHLVGIHNYLNSLVSLALVSSIDIVIDADLIKQKLLIFNGVAHRMQKIATHNNIVFIEDSKGTNVGAVVAGVSGLTMPVNLILGGDGKGQDFNGLIELIDKKCRSVAIIGADADKIYAALLQTNLNLQGKIQLFKTLDEAVYYCYNNAISGDYVVLSPACASWDMFDNYKHRAQVFNDIVLKITNN